MICVLVAACCVPGKGQASVDGLRQFWPLALLLLKLEGSPANYNAVQHLVDSDQGCENQGSCIGPIEIQAGFCLFSLSHMKAIEYTMLAPYDNIF